MTQTEIHRMIKTWSRFFFIAAVTAAAAVGAGGCTVTGTAVGAGATAGVAAYQERGIEGVAKDLKITAGVVDAMFRHDNTLNLIIGVESYEGRVLLTGSVKNPQSRADAVRLAWTVSGVKDVINEVQVNPDSGIVDLARDSWVTAQLQSKITLDRNILAINYVIETVNGTVYLIGIAQDKSELDRVKDHARTISYVRQVVSHVRVKGAP